jgi:hypothetical protein
MIVWWDNNVETMNQVSMLDTTATEASATSSDPIVKKTSDAGNGASRNTHDDSYTDDENDII